MLASLLLIGCRGPAGFWYSYQHDFVAAQHSDQGPWGGSLWIQWQGSERVFMAADAAAFAGRQGWKCDAPVAYGAEAIRDWTFLGERVFPLLFAEGVKDAHVRQFPRQIQTDSWVVKCDTGWTRVEPGSAASRPAYGFIHISTDGQAMAVYYLWGEG